MDADFVALRHGDLAGLTSDTGKQAIREVAEFLTEHGAHDAAEEAEEMHCAIAHAERQIAVRHKRLHGLIHAIDRVRTGDGGMAGYHAALPAYRSGGA